MGVSHSRLPGVGSPPIKCTSRVTLKIQEHLTWGMDSRSIQNHNLGSDWTLPPWNSTGASGMTECEGKAQEMGHPA